MSNINIIFNLNEIIPSINFFKIVIVILCSYYTCFKLINKKCSYKAYNIIFVFIVVVFLVKITEESKFTINIICQVLLLSILLWKEEKNNIGYNILISIVSIVINYILLLLYIEI